MMNWKAQPARRTPAPAGKVDLAARPALRSDTRAAELGAAIGWLGHTSPPAALPVRWLARAYA